MTELDIIKSFENRKILLVGDTILDIYSYGKEVCKSSDSEAPEIEEEKVEVSFGGASLVAKNILELGGFLVYFSVIGDDENAKHYDSFKHPKLDKHFLIDKNRRTTTKRRFWVDNYKLFQINEVDNQDINAGLEKKLVEAIKSYVNEVDLILVLDAQHGLLTKTLIKYLIKLSKEYNKPLYVDAQVSHRNSNHHLYKGVDCLFFNQREAEGADPEFDINHPEFSLNSIKKKLDIVNVIVKMGKQGSIALINNKYIKSSSYQVATVDACGAGDAFLAAFSLGNPELMVETLDISNTWAGLSTAIYGTIPPKKQDLIKIYHG